MAGGRCAAGRSAPEGRLQPARQLAGGELRAIAVEEAGDDAVMRGPRSHELLPPRPLMRL